MIILAIIHALFMLWSSGSVSMESQQLGDIAHKDFKTYGTYCLKTLSKH